MSDAQTADREVSTTPARRARRTGAAAKKHAPRQGDKSASDNFTTPDKFIHATKALIGIDHFAVDYAADRTNAKALTYLTETDNALDPRWNWRTYLQHDREWGWLNPPFSNIAPFAERCKLLKLQGGRVAFLVPASVGANWYRDHVDKRALVLALNGRIPFMPDRPKWGYPKDCMLVLYAPEIRPGFEVWTWPAPALARLVRLVRGSTP